MLLAKRLGEVSSYFILFLLLLGFGGFLVFFLSFTFVAWFNEIVNSKYLGHLVISGFYLVIMLVVFLFRKPLIFSPIRKLFGEIFIGEESENPEDINSFKSQAKLTSDLKKYKKGINEKENLLKKNFSQLGNQLTIRNIIQTVAKNAYASFITTSNIAKMAFNLIKRFTSKKKKVKRKKSKSAPELEE